MPIRIGLKMIEMPTWSDDMEKAVCEYEKEPIQKGQIVFYGPSHFTRWKMEPWGAKPLREAVLGASGAQCCINRGFGSSCAEHQLYYYHRMVKPLEPKVLVYFSYGNSKGFGYSPEETWELAQRVIAYTRIDFPDTEIYICGMTRHKNDPVEPSDDIKLYQSWIMEYCENDPKCHYIDFYSDADISRPENFCEDSVHFSPTGYEAFAKFFQRDLKGELAKF